VEPRVRTIVLLVKRNSVVWIVGTRIELHGGKEPKRPDLTSKKLLYFLGPKLQLRNIKRPASLKRRKEISPKNQDLYPTWKDCKNKRIANFRGSMRGKGGIPPT